MRIINAICQNKFLLRLHQYQKMGNSSRNCFWENKEGSESMVKGNDFHEKKINAGTWQLFMLSTAKFPPSSSGDDDFFHEGRYFKNINCSCKSMLWLFWQICTQIPSALLKQKDPSRQLLLQHKEMQQGCAHSPQTYLNLFSLFFKQPHRLLAITSRNYYFNLLQHTEAALLTSACSSRWASPRWVCLAQFYRLNSYFHSCRT